MKSLAVLCVALAAVAAGCGSTTAGRFTLPVTAKCIQRQAVVQSSGEVAGTGDFRTLANGQPVGSGGDLNLTLFDGNPAIVWFVRNGGEAKQVEQANSTVDGLDFTYTLRGNVVYATPGATKSTVDSLMNTCLK